MKTLFGILCLFVAAPAFAADTDGDGVDSDVTVSNPADCDDTNIAINPGATEICADTVDNNCDGLIDAADTTACPAGTQTSAAAPTPEEVREACTKCATPSQVEQWVKFEKVCTEHGGTINVAKCKECVLPEGDGGLVSWFTGLYKSGMERRMDDQAVQITTLEEAVARLESRDVITRGEVDQIVTTLREVSDKADLTAEEVEKAKTALAKLKERADQVDIDLADFSIEVRRIKERLGTIERGVAELQKSGLVFNGIAGGMFGGHRAFELPICRDGLICEDGYRPRELLDTRTLRSGGFGGGLLAVEIGFQGKKGTATGLRLGIDIRGERSEDSDFQARHVAGVRLFVEPFVVKPVGYGWTVGGHVTGSWDATALKPTGPSVAAFNIGAGPEATWYPEKADGSRSSCGVYLSGTVGGGVVGTSMGDTTSNVPDFTGLVVAGLKCGHQPQK